MPSYDFARYLNIRSAYSSSFTPDGDRLAFLTNITGVPQVWQAPARGGWPDQLTFFDDRISFIEYAPSAVLEAISPIHKVDCIRAPLMVIHGANDPRVPIGEAEQIVASINARGGVVEYLRFDDEGHGIVKLANRLACYPAIAEFLDRHLQRRAD